MKLSGENIIPADQELVWKALNDVDVLRQAIPGCEQLEAVNENEYTATIVTRIGPVKAKFNGNVQLTDLNPPNGYTLVGSGSAGSMGNAKATAQVTLQPVSEGTHLRYNVDAEITGKIAQLGARLIESTAGILAGQFFKRFSALVTGDKDLAKSTAMGIWPYVIGGGLGLLLIIFIIYMMG